MEHEKLADTALKTANSGYLTDAWLMLNSIITIEDCFTTKYITAEALIEEEGDRILIRKNSG